MRILSFIGISFLFSVFFRKKIIGTALYCVGYVLFLSIRQVTDFSPAEVINLLC